MSKILDNLFVGSVEESFEDHGCEYILNVASELDLLDRVGKLDSLTKLTYKKIGMNDDDPDDDIRKIIPECLDFICNAIQNNGKVFVHCLEGKSRSILICIAYLITQEYTFDNAFNYVKTCSKRFDPFENYVLQVREYFSKN